MSATVPAPPAQAPDQPILLHGCELVKYLLRHDSAALLTDHDLETADHAIGFLLARQARPNEEISPVYFARLQDCRRLITHSKNGRAADRAALAAELDTKPPAPPTGGPRPGKGGEHQPAGPLPKTQPPAPGHAQPAPPPARRDAPRFAPPRQPIPITPGPAPRTWTPPDDF